MEPTCEEVAGFLDQIGIPASSSLRDYPDGPLWRDHVFDPDGAS
jgi:hypothetical protein